MRPSFDTLYVSMCYLVATRSEDDSTKTGAVLTTEDNDLVAIGYNGLPRGIDLEEFMVERPEKYRWFEHAERNAIFNAARINARLDLATTLYVNWIPCHDCMRAVLQSTNIDTVIYHEDGQLWYDQHKGSNCTFDASILASLKMAARKDVSVRPYQGPLLFNHGFFSGNAINFEKFDLNWE